MPRHRAHTQICHACDRRKPLAGFRSNLCADCVKLDLARFTVGQLVNALHLAMRGSRKPTWSEVCGELNKPGFDGAK